MQDPHDGRLNAQLAAVARRNLARAAPRISHRRGVDYRLDGHEVVGLCSNDYLGFADHPTLANLPPSPAGATASRLVSGDLEVHRQVERKFAEHVGTADAVVFPSGFQLNVGVLPALLPAQDHVFSDALNHASLIDGLRLSRAPRTIIPHRSTPPGPPEAIEGFAWWVAEGIYSMDGDRTDPSAIREYLDAGNCVYLDEAHSFGLFSRGLGLAGAHSLMPTALVCTLGKATGCAGAFVAGSSALCAWVRSHARSFVFSTAVSPALALRISSALDLVRGALGDDARERLWNNVARLGRLLDDPDAPSPVFPVHVGENQHALEISADLCRRGWHVQPIRPPTVPAGTARLRVTVSADHTRDQLDRFVEDLARVLQRRDLPLVVRRGNGPDPHAGAQSETSSPP